jgi:hypothetical protein
MITLTKLSDHISKTTVPTQKEEFFSQMDSQKSFNVVCTLQLVLEFGE